MYFNSCAMSSQLSCLPTILFMGGMMSLPVWSHVSSRGVFPPRRGVFTPKWPLHPTRMHSCAQKFRKELESKEFLVDGGRHCTIKLFGSTKLKLTWNAVNPLKVQHARTIVIVTFKLYWFYWDHWCFNKLIWLVTRTLQSFYLKHQWTFIIQWRIYITQLTSL